MIVRVILSILMLLSFGACEKKSDQESLPAKSDSTNTIRYVIIESGDGFGYEIFDGEKKMISQPYMPGVGGEKSFREKDDAQKVAHFVVSKIEKGEFPPSVSASELDSLLN